LLCINYKNLFVGFTLNIEENAGTGASFHNEDYHNAGAKIVTRNAAYASNIILRVRQPSQEVCLIKNIFLSLKQQSFLLL
jgi:alanine dehydrogenase